MVNGIKELLKHLKTASIKIYIQIFPLRLCYGVLLTKQEIKQILWLLKEPVLINSWPDTAQWSNAPEWAIARSIDQEGSCYFHGIAKHYGRYNTSSVYCGKAINKDFDWNTSMEYRFLNDSVQDILYVMDKMQIGGYQSETIIY